MKKLFVLFIFSIQALFAATVDLRSSFIPAQFQGSRNTCQSFAATSLMEFLLFEKTGTMIPLSVEYTYTSGRKVAMSRPYTKNAYMNVDGLAGFLAVEGLRFGAVAAANWPYNPNPQPTITTPAPPNLSKMIIPYKALAKYIPKTQISAYLLKYKKPVVMNIMWYFSAAESGQVRLPKAEEVAACQEGNNSSVCGGHVILLVGYDSTTKRFIFRNSFGQKYGQAGYGTIPEEYIVNYCETCAYESQIDAMPADEQKDFLIRSLHGVSAHLQ